jgi:TPR repeat protein
LQNAASANDPRAMDRLANCYHKGIGTDRNDREAFRLYSAASRLNYLDSMGNLGVLYLTSDETDLGKDQAKRTEKAVSLFRDGARQNNALCMYLYARCLEAGTGVSADAQEAAVWYRRAANSGNPAAQEWCRQHNLDPGSNPSP